MPMKKPPGATDGLREIATVRQVPGEEPRRWFTSDEFDLFVWCDGAGAVKAFQLCYDKPRSEHALVWKRGARFAHFAVDDGEGRPFRHKGSPLLVADGPLDVARVADRLVQAGGEVPRDVLEFVLARVRELGETGRP